MITVRFASGFSVQYNAANHAQWLSGCEYVHLYERQKDGVYSGWIATVPLSAILEVRPPCRTYNAIEESGQQLVDEFLSRIQSAELRANLPRYDLAEIKRALRAFNGKTKTWRSR